MRSRTALVALATAGLCVAASSSALGAVAALQDDQLVSVDMSEIEGRLDTLAATRARVARFDIFWNEVARTRPANPTNPDDPAYDWSRADTVLRGMADRGIRPLVSVYSTPTWSAGRPAPTGAEFTQYNPHAPRAGDYGRFMQAVAKRYSGRHFSPDFIEPLPRVNMWEVWNEPNLKRFFRKGTGSSLPAYLQLVREAYPAIKRQNPAAVVMVGATGPRGSTGDGSIGARVWLAGIARAPLSLKFDAYSQHIYPATAPTSKKNVFPSWMSLPEIFAQLDTRRAREISAARGAARARLMRAPKIPVFITEAGYTTKRTEVRTVQVTVAQQATYLRQIFQLRDVRASRVPVVVWFNMQDNDAWPGGLFTETGARKPSYAAFLAQARIGGLPAGVR